ncbi:Testis-specific zinc finger protein topi [Lucilia cuprina]|uniref:Testis-specific zinc finger protein topi n=1 Tax=Lucilia cuprina TaxID=7375 RepID=A0A0L0BYI1_LUCCU|nr:Testis-specific zinc finger protein topi [Lucilia cuprina]
MNLNEEDLNTSDAWLSDQLFAQLKDLNSEYKDKNTPTDFLLSETFQNCSSSMPLLDGYDDIPLQELKSTPLDTFESALNVNSFSNSYDINEVLDLSQMPLKVPGIDTTQPEGNMIDIVDNIPLLRGPTVGNVETFANDVTKNVPFDANEEVIKILKFLETQPKEEVIEVTNTPPILLPTTVTQKVIKCANCNSIFNMDEFQSHICDYDEDHNLITSKITKVSNTIKPVKEEPLLPTEPACIRLLKENQIRIRRFLKDELKYDVNSCLNAITPSSNTSGSNASYSSNVSINSNKKQDGPHECTLCERKFVHASGLLRHMEKHALDLIPTTNTTTNNKNISTQGAHGVNGLRVVIKCTLCGRIFFESNEALNHLYSHFPDSLYEEKELDNCSEIPYDAYIDDALNSLRVEVQEGSFYNSSISNFQEEKTPLYLKIVILSCILQCEFCDLIFSEVSYLFVHSACHLPFRRFECFSCDIHVRTSKEICTHWQAECVFMRENLKVHRTTTQRYFVCNVCENKFQSMELLHEHRYTSYHFFPRLNKVTGTLQLPCEYCESIFENAQECVTHYEEKHYRKYKRDKDGTSGSSKTRQYLCDICGKSYTQSSHLWQHLRFHQGVKPFACKEPGCTRKFTIRPDLNDHIRKCHTGERPYHCLVCGKRFLTGSVFYQHRLIHRGERRYECEACGKRFYRADALKNHQRIHTGEKPFGCHFCTKNFRQRGDRDKHIRARHSHLDANARLMMQMQKLQLEAAAAQDHDAQKLEISTNSQDYVSVSHENIKSPLEHDPTKFSYVRNNNNINDIFMMGNVEFSKNVFESIISDIID